MTRPGLPRGLFNIIASATCVKDAAIYLIKLTLLEIRRGFHFQGEMVMHGKMIDRRRSGDPGAGPALGSTITSTTPRAPLGRSSHH